MNDTVSKVREYLMAHELCAGLRNGERACTIASINLALGRPLSGARPACMPPTIHRWAIIVQDAAPAWMRNSVQWKEAAALSCGADLSDAAERNRAAMLLGWMWDRLTAIQHVADATGFGDEWRRMLAERTHAAASSASLAAAVAAERAAAVAAERAAEAEAEAAEAAEAAEWAASSAEAAAREELSGRYWRDADCPGLLLKLAQVTA